MGQSVEVREPREGKQTMPDRFGVFALNALPGHLRGLDQNTINLQDRSAPAHPGTTQFYGAGMRVWIGDEANGIQAEATIKRTAAARLKWPEGITAASWLHETALRLYPDSKYAKAHGG